MSRNFREAPGCRARLPGPAQPTQFPQKSSGQDIIPLRSANQKTELRTVNWPCEGPCGGQLGCLPWLHNLLGESAEPSCLLDA